MFGVININPLMLMETLCNEMGLELSDSSISPMFFVEDEAASHQIVDIWCMINEDPSPCVLDGEFLKDGIVPQFAFRTSLGLPRA